MSAVALWSLFVTMGIVTLLLRASILLVHERLAIPRAVRRALAYVPQAVLAALVAPALFAPSGAAGSLVDVRLAAALVALVVAWRFRSVLATLAVGMGLLWTLSALVGRLSG